MDFNINSSFWKIILFIVVIIVLYNLIFVNEENFQVGECNNKSCGIDCECDEKCTNQQPDDKFSPCSCKGPTRMIF